MDLLVALVLLGLLAIAVEPALPLLTTLVLADPPVPLTALIDLVRVPEPFNASDLTLATEVERSLGPYSTFLRLLE